MELHMDDAEEIQDWAKALRLHTERSVPKASPKAVASPTSPSKDEVEELSEQADEECSLLRAKSQKLQQRIATLETLSDRREKQMKRLLKRLDGAMQMLEALEDMCGQQRKVISAQQQAISALKEEGAVDDDEEEEEAETGDDSNREDMDLSEEKMMALLQQAQQMEQALKQIEALSKAGGAGPQAEGDVEAILSRLHALEEEKANFDRMARRESAWAVRKAHSSDEVLGREDRDCGDSDWSWRSPRLQSLGLLLLACVANQACRALPFYLVDFGDGKAGQAMNQDLDFNSADYGFFATLCFSVPLFLVKHVLPAYGRIPYDDELPCFQRCGMVGAPSENFLVLRTERTGSRSLSTAGMAVASSYGGLLLLRVALGLSQAATNPAALSLIAELFPDARATANSIFGLGIYLGGALASLGAFVDEQEGWRAACLVFGFFSVAASLPALTKRDEKQALVRRSTWPADDMDLQTRLASLPEAAATVWESSTEAVAPTGARWLLLASALRFSAGFAILVWLPSSVRATFPNDVEQFAIVNSLIKGFAGSISSISGGLAADALRSRGFGDRSAAWFCAASSILSAPLWYFTLADGFSFEVCMGFLCAEYLVAESWLGAAISALQGAVPADRRGTAQGVFSSLTALGQALPVGLGLLAPEDLTQGLQLSVSVCYCLSGLCFLIASSHLSQEVPQDER
ncbi:unnamed protein product [Durusdinium trenchii]|uniref:PH domain-containing protein n=1 Tax=Durusdinium trenchii TaxID=1381693 RepID=A0ABP0SZK5_9DINO